MLALQFWRGRPQLLLEDGTRGLKVEVNVTVNDGEWHTIHLRLTSHGVALMVDFCGRGWDNTTRDDSHCAARVSWDDSGGTEAWAGSWPLQVGGLAHASPSPAHHGWREAPTPRPLDGCVSHLTLNGQLVDLGEPAYSRGSVGGCRPQDEGCPGGCGHRGQCVGGLGHPQCECDPGWAGPGCSTPTVPTTFGSHASHIKMALSLGHGPRMMTVQLRLRTRDAAHALLLHLAGNQQAAAALTIYLRGGVACASASDGGRATRTACVEGRPLGDGKWHTVRAERHGHNLVVSVDDGDDWRRNESLSWLGGAPPGQGGAVIDPPLPLGVDEVTVGGLPELVGVEFLTALTHLNHSCVDDVRVSGRRLPLPPAVNATTWGQVTTWQGVETDCSAQDACLNTTCPQPLSCVSTWGQASCSCGSGRQLVGRSCEDVDECLWRPCLHGGSCYNLRPGFQCVCGPGHTGQYCQWADLATVGHHPLAAPLAIAALTVSLLLLVVVGVVISLRLRRHWFTRDVAVARGQQGGVAGQDGTKVEVKGGTEEGGGEPGEERHLALLQCLELDPHARPGLLEKGEKVTAPTSASSTASVSLDTTSPPKTTVVPISAAVGVVADAGVVVVKADCVRVGAKVGLDPLPAKDDLRAYAYEGDGSSAGSLSSALSGLREEQPEGTIRPLVTEFLEVMDLLKNLPETTKSPSPLKKSGDQRVGSTIECPARTVQGQTKTPECKRAEVSAVTSKEIRSTFIETKEPTETFGCISTSRGGEDQATFC